MNRTPAIDQFLKGGVGSGIKGHTTFRDSNTSALNIRALMGVFGKVFYDKMKKWQEEFPEEGVDREWMKSEVEQELRISVDIPLKNTTGWLYKKDKEGRIVEKSSKFPHESSSLMHGCYYNAIDAVKKHHDKGYELAYGIMVDKERLAAWETSAKEGKNIGPAVRPFTMHAFVVKNGRVYDPTLGANKDDYYAYDIVPKSSWEKFSYKENDKDYNAKDFTVWIEEKMRKQDSKKITLEKYASVGEKGLEDNLKKVYTDFQKGGVGFEQNPGFKVSRLQPEDQVSDINNISKTSQIRGKEMTIDSTPAIDALIQKGGKGSGVKGHTTAKELAIKKKLDSLDKARKAADALADKDIKEGQRMIDKANKAYEVSFEEILRLGTEGTRAQYAEATKKKEGIKKQELAGWDLRLKGQNRKSEIGEKYHTAAMKLMEFSRGVSPKSSTKEGTPALKYKEGPKSGQTSDSNTATVDNVPSSILERSGNDSNDIIGISDRGEFFSMINGRLFTQNEAADMIRYLDQSNKAHRRIPTGGIDLFSKPGDGEVSRRQHRLSNVDLPPKWVDPLPRASKAPVKSEPISHEDSMIRVENTIKEIFPSYPLDHAGDLITVSTLGNGDTLLRAYIPTEDRGMDASGKDLKSYEDKWKPVIARLQNNLRIQGFRDMKVTLDYGEKGHIGLEVSGTLKKGKGESKPSGKEQPTLTLDTPKSKPKSHLLATKYAEAAVKRGTLFKELGKKSKKELKDMIQQDSRLDMSGTLSQMTKSDMKYHITSGKYSSPRGSEEAYNALTKQERKGLLKPIPDPKTPKAKGSEPPRRGNAPPIKAIQVEGIDSYQATHGKKPRGTGLWMFQIGEDKNNTYSANTNYKEAKRQAKRQAQKEMKWSIKVLT